MKIRLVSVGKPRDRALAALHDRYAERIRRFGMTYDTAQVAEVRAEGRFSDAHVRQREAAGLWGAVASPGRVGALDAAAGELLSSEQLAGRLERWATPRLTLLVGGPLGLDADLVARVDHVWSLSPLTFPHELVRVLVAEQLYRALCILRGTPYHK